MVTTNHALRHPLQIIVCVGQIYGLILYYATSMFDHYYKEVTYSRPEFLYFWFYYFFMNFIWMVFPGSKLTQLERYEWPSRKSKTNTLDSSASQQCAKDCDGLRYPREDQRKEELERFGQEGNIIGECASRSMLRGVHK